MVELTTEQIDWIISEFKISFFGLYKETYSHINMRCPYCGDSKKSLHKMRGWLYKKTGTYHCFNCDKSATGFGLLAKIKECSISDIKKQFYLISKNHETKFELPVDKPEVVIQNIRPYTGEIEHIAPLSSWTDLNPECKKYLNARHIYDAPGFDKSMSLYYDLKTDRIVFPWKENNLIVYYQSRAIRKNQTPKYLFPAGLKKKIYGLDNIDESLSYIAYTEGLLDAIFVKNCIAVGGLQPTREQQIKLKNLYPNMKFIWISDNFWIDKASQDAIINVCNKNPRALLFNWPKVSAKDINELVCKEKNYNKFWSENYILNNTITAAQAKVLLTFSK